MPEQAVLPVTDAMIKSFATVVVIAALQDATPVAAQVFAPSIAIGSITKLPVTTIESTSVALL